MRPALCFLLLLASAACELSAQGRCRLAPAQHLALAEGADFDATALVGGPRGGLALYSDRAGLWAISIREDGSPASAAQRIGERCAGGVAAVNVDGDVAVACTRLEDAATASVHALRVHVTATEITHGAELRVATVGPASRDLALVNTGVDLALAFHDGGPAGHQVWLARLPVGLASPPSKAPESLAKAGVLARSPALLAKGGKLYAAFVTWDLAFATQHADLVVRELDGTGSSQLRLRHFDATPRLSADADGVLLSYRDRPTAQARVEQFVARLGPTLALRQAPVRVGRASGVWGPSLDHCGDRSFSATPIEHGSELYVVFHALDAGFHALEPNHQCYATDRDLVAAQTACSGRDVLALVAEQTDPSGAHAELLGMRFTCAP